MKISQSLMDSLAIGASCICMIHCLALPLILAALPTVAQIFHIPESFHLIMLAIAVPTSALALAQGYRSHLAIVPTIVGIAGISLISTGALWLNVQAFETELTVIGSIMLALAHVGNWQLAQRRHQH